MVLWTYAMETRTPALETRIIEAKACPYCPSGKPRRLAVRDLAYPYQWHPCGYACDSCYGMWFEKAKGIRIP